nr:lipocalin family protein [uncultured Gellertiella sp.]
MKKRRFSLAAVLFALASSISGAEAAQASPPVVAVARDHYRGTWLEIGRRPMWLTDGCVAGFTTYRPGRTARDILVTDGCREGTPGGKLKTIEGRGTLADADTTRAKLHVRYPLLITFDYWVRYQSPDHRWFISADPAMRNLWIYAREVPSRASLARMVRKARALGYDVRKLEFPAQ